MRPSRNLWGPFWKIVTRDPDTIKNSTSLALYGPATEAQGRLPHHLNPPHFHFTLMLPIGGHLGDGNAGQAWPFPQINTDFDEESHWITGEIIPSNSFTSSHLFPFNVFRQQFFPASYSSPCPEGSAQQPLFLPYQAKK